MRNRARNLSEPETLFERFGGDWLTAQPRDNRFNLIVLYPGTRAYVVREEAGERGST